MIRTVPFAAIAVALAASMIPATATSAPTATPGAAPRPAPTAVVAKDTPHDAGRGEAWESASRRSRRASDLRQVMVGDSELGSTHTRFTWKTAVVQKRRPDVMRTYSTFATTPQTNTGVEVRLVQVNHHTPEAFLFVNGNTRGCLYRNGTPPIAFDQRTSTVTLDILTACLKSATNDEGGLRLDQSAMVTIARERPNSDRVIGHDDVLFGLVF